MLYKARERRGDRCADKRACALPCGKPPRRTSRGPTFNLTLYFSSRPPLEGNMPVRATHRSLHTAPTSRAAHCRRTRRATSTINRAVYAAFPPAETALMGGVMESALSRASNPAAGNTGGMESGLGRTFVHYTSFRCGLRTTPHHAHLPLPRHAAPYLLSPPAPLTRGSRTAARHGDNLLLWRM